MTAELVSGAIRVSLEPEEWAQVRESFGIESFHTGGTVRSYVGFSVYDDERVIELSPEVRK